MIQFNYKSIYLRITDVNSHIKNVIKEKLDKIYKT